MNIFEKMKFTRNLKNHIHTRVANKQKLLLGTKDFTLFSSHSGEEMGTIQTKIYYSDNEGLLKLVVNPIIQSKYQGRREILQSIHLQLFNLDETDNVNLILDDRKSYTLTEFKNQIVNSSDIRKYIIKNGSIEQSIPFSDYESKFNSGDFYVFETPFSSPITFYSDEDIKELVSTNEYLSLFGMTPPNLERCSGAIRSAKLSMFKSDCDACIDRLVQGGYAPVELNFLLNIHIHTTSVNSSSSTIAQAQFYSYQFENYKFTLSGY